MSLEEEDINTSSFSLVEDISCGGLTTNVPTLQSIRRMCKSAKQERERERERNHVRFTLFLSVKGCDVFSLLLLLDEDKNAGNDDSRVEFVLRLDFNALSKI